MSTEVMFDTTDPGLRRDPYPTYRRLREEAPAWLGPDGIWYFSRYHDCFNIFRSPTVTYDVTDTRAFRARLSPDPDQARDQLAFAKEYRSLLEMDPPDHTRVRTLINRAFTMPSVEGSRTLIERYVDELMDHFEGPALDLVEAFGSMLPIIVICDMMGVHPEERHQFLQLGNEVARSVDPDISLEDFAAVQSRLHAYIAGLIDARRGAPGDDLMTKLIDASEDGRVASQAELIMNTGALLIAGFETTTNLITNGVYRLLEHPEELVRLQGDPTLIRTTVEEVLRYDPPAQLLSPRGIVADTEIGGIELHAGDAVIPIMAAANRDPEEFEDPERFDISRHPNRHLSFGVGIHLCVGAALARMEAQTALLRLFQRFPALKLDPQEGPEYRPNLSLRGFSKLPVVLG